MLGHHLTRTRPLVHLAFGVGVFALLVCAPASAQSPGDVASDYRLTMPVLRKALPALFAAGKESCTRRHRDQREVAEMTVAQMARENVTLVRQNEAELGRLTGQHQP
ncbi:MAG: hypothetical protein ACJ8DJ_06475 [Gemmatimonadales bacterium]